MTKNLLEGLAKQGTKPVDNVATQLTENEYVIPADVVIAVGEGNAEKGVAFFDNFVEKVRQQTQSTLTRMGA
jgi:protein-tyrosine-phosphatase